MVYKSQQDVSRKDITFYFHYHCELSSLKSNARLCFPKSGSIYNCETFAWKRSFFKSPML